MISPPNYSNPYMYNAYGQQHYQNYYPQNYGYQQPYYPQYNQPCRQCPQAYYPNYTNYPRNCQNCAQYGLASNQPRFPSKLPYSFVTSGERIQDKFVINQPQQSAPFPTQHRKTYMPYTRKYIEYQDHIQYIPVQRSQWNYEKVMKQIDFVPQQYYESNIEYVPQQRTSHRVKYLPVEQKIVHMPVDSLQQQQQKEYISGMSAGQPVMSSRIIQVRDGNVFNPMATNAFVSPKPSQPYSRLAAQQNRRVFETTQPTVGRAPSGIHPAQSEVQMVPSRRLRPVESIAQQIHPSQINQNAYQFPTSGGVIIGSSLNSQPSQIQDPNISGADRVQASEVLASVLNKLPQQSHNQDLDFRGSGKVFSEEFNMDHNEYKKKQSIFNRFQQDLSQ